MKVTVNRQLFIEHISPIPANNGISILVADGILSAASFDHGVITRIPAYVIKDGQVFLSNDEWNNFISMIETHQATYIDIDI